MALIRATDAPPKRSMIFTGRSSERQVSNTREPRQGRLPSMRADVIPRAQSVAHGECFEIQRGECQAWGYDEQTAMAPWGAPGSTSRRRIRPAFRGPTEAFACRGVEFHGLCKWAPL